MYCVVCVCIVGVCVVCVCVYCVVCVCVLWDVCVCKTCAIHREDIPKFHQIVKGNHDYLALQKYWLL